MSVMSILLSGRVRHSRVGPLSDIVWRWLTHADVSNGSGGPHIEGQQPCPDRQVVVVLIVCGRTGADLCRGFFDPKSKYSGGLQLFLTRTTDLSPAPGD